MNNNSDDADVIELPLNEAFHYRPVNTVIHEPYAIARLMEHPARVENSLDYAVILQDIGTVGTRSLAVRWTWTDKMIPPTPLGGATGVYHGGGGLRAGVRSDCPIHSGRVGSSGRTQ